MTASALAAVDVALADGLDHAQAGDGRLVLLFGEAGIGKTSAARRAAASARRRGLLVRWAGCSMGATVAHAPWIALLATLGPTGERAAASLRASTLVGDLAAGAARSQAYAAVIAALESDVDRPLLAVIDDLQWADEGTLRLLGAVATQLPALPVALVGTYRDGDVAPGSPLTMLGGGVDRVEVPGLDKSAAAALLERHLSRGRSARLAEGVVELTGGNPFLIVQLGRLASDQESSLDLIALPAGARDLLQQRLAALASEDRDLLLAAGVLGREFRVQELAQVVGQTPSGVVLGLDRCAARRIVQRAPGNSAWAFVHDLFRHAAIEASDAVELRRLHGRAAAALAAGGAEPAEVAAHLLAAGPARSGDAAEWAVRAGDRALHAMSWEEAAAQYRSALAALDAGSPNQAGETHCEGLIGLGRALVLSGDYEHGSEVFLDAADVARGLGSPRLLARAALGFGADLAGFEVRLFDQRQIDLLDEAADALDDTADAGLHATVLARLSVALSLSAVDSRRLALAERALELAELADEPIVIARALAAHCDAIAGPSEVDRRLAESARIVELAIGEHDAALELLGRRLRYVALLERGDVAGLERETAAYAQRADAFGNPLYSWYVPLWQAQLAVVAGDVDRAQRLAEQAAETGRRAGSLNAPMLATVIGLAIHWQRGEYAEAMTAFGQLETVEPELVDYITALGGQAASLALAGRRSQAAALLDRAGALGLGSHLDDAEWLSNMFNIVRAAVILEHEILAEAVAALEPYAGLVAFEGIGAGLYGSVARIVALGCRSLGRTEDSLRYGRQALAVNRRFGGSLLADGLRTLAACSESAGEQAAARKLHADADRQYLATGSNGGIDDLAGPGTSGPGETSAAGAPEEAGNELRRDGEVWHLRYRGHDTLLKHRKGLADLAVLLARPGTEVHVSELAGVHAGIVRGSGGDALDRQAVEAYRRRLGDLVEDLDEADARHDVSRTERLRVEHDALVDQLAGAFALGGRSRAAGPEPIERLRKAVSARIRDSIGRIESEDPALGLHLRNSVHTGTYISYDPELPTRWRC